MTFSTHAADLLLAARAGGPAVLACDILPAGRADAFAVQDATLARLGPVGGWKVGAKGRHAEPACAPLPAAGLLASGTVLHGNAWRLRGIEVELALRLGRDLRPNGRLLGADELADAIDTALPAVEVVETRLADWHGSDPLAQLADLQSHGALLLGAPSDVPPRQLDLTTLAAQLSFDGTTVADTCGGNPAADLWRLLGWLALQAEQRGQPLRAGQVVTTGSCTGMLFAPAGGTVRARLTGIGAVALQF